MSFHGTRVALNSYGMRRWLRRVRRRAPTAMTRGSFGWSEWPSQSPGGKPGKWWLVPGDYWSGYIGSVRRRKQRAAMRDAERRTAKRKGERRWRSEVDR